MPEKALSPDVGKQCVFCGARPAMRSKEHVLPLWLIEMTGDANRQASFVTYHDGRARHRSFAFDRLTARACDGCNGEWSLLEGRVRDVVATLMNGEDCLTHQQAELLLDWFDKVRIGLWLGGLAIGGNPFQIEPKFHVTDRMRMKDRLLYIARSAQPSKRLTVGDFCHPVFQLCPSYFRLYANGLAFVSASCLGIAAGPLGFPRLKACEVLASGHQSVEVREGRTNWGAAPQHFGILAQAIWGNGVLSTSQAQACGDRVHNGGLKSRVHVQVTGRMDVLSNVPGRVVPAGTLGSEELLYRSEDLLLRLRRYLIRQEIWPPGFSRSWSELKTILRAEERAVTSIIRSRY